MRTFYEEWRVLDSSPDEKKSLDRSESLKLQGSKLSSQTINTNWNLQVPKYDGFPMMDFLHVCFTHHRVILGRVKDYEARLFYITQCAQEHMSVQALNKSIAADEYHHRCTLPNNFERTLSPSLLAYKAIEVFKDEYLLDFINVEQLNIRDVQDVDERIVENSIIHNVKNFILTFGKDFAFVRNQYHLEAFGEAQYIDLLFFNRALNCLVAVELTNGKFKTSYLGQLQGYLSILDGFEKKPHENPSIGIILCKDMNKAFVDYVIQDYSKPMGVATYRTSEDMSEEFRKALPDVEDLRKLLEKEDCQFM